MMRVSSRKQDKDFREDFENYHVYLDDCLLALCFYADEEKGIAKVYVTLEDGRIAATPTGRAMTKTLKGKVTIVNSKTH